MDDYFILFSSSHISDTLSILFLTYWFFLLYWKICRTSVESHSHTYQHLHSDILTVPQSYAYIYLSKASSSICAIDHIHTCQLENIASTVIFFSFFFDLFPAAFEHIISPTLKKKVFGSSLMV